MKIGIVTTWFERGAAYVSRQYRDLLRSSGHDAVIFARGGEHYAQNDPNWNSTDVTWSTYQADPVSSFPENEFRQWIRTNKLEAVLFNEQVWLPPLLWARQEGALSIGYVDYYTEKTVKIFELYDALVCNTARHMSVFKWHPQVLYLPWGTDIKLFHPRTFKCLKKEGPVFFHSGGMNPFRKGTDLVLGAFANLEGPASLVLHLQKPLKNAYPELYEKIQKYIDNSQNIEVIIKDVPAPGLYHKGDVYVYPSRLDGIGLTQAEALSCGLPLITADNAPMNEFANHESGFTVPIESYWTRNDGYYWPMCQVDIEQLTATMQFFINNFKILPALKMKAREYAEKHLNWEDRGALFSSWISGLKFSNSNQFGLRDIQDRLIS